MSWYPVKEKLKVSEQKYLRDIETIFKVMDPLKRWIPYKLEPHQKEWHLQDIVLKGPDSKHKIVIKSRNTSFTVSSVVSILMSIPFYPNQIIPVVRLNQARANDLIQEMKEIINHMNVIKESNGQYFPFDPREVNMEALGSIKFPNGVEIRAFPATNSASESIRGLRIAGNALIDETNYMKDFKNIYIALRDAAAGSIDGKKEFQILMGTTRKGRATPFNLWFEEIEVIQPDNMIIFRWPVFDPLKVNLSVSLLEQNLSPIVKWHDLKDLEQKRLENMNTFKEEYMAMLVDGDDQFYEFYTIQNALNQGEKLELTQSKPEANKEYMMGIDPATGVNKDYFCITVYETVDEMRIQRFLYYTKDKELPQMEEECIRIIDEWNPVKVRVDSVGVGTQISQKLVQIFGEQMIEPLKGQMTIKGLKRRIPLRLNEYLHTNQKSLMAFNRIAIINDETQIRHYTAWDSDYKAESGVAGHGDITMASGYALLPLDWRKGKLPVAMSSSTSTPGDSDNKFYKQIQEKYAKKDTEKKPMTVMDRVEWYRRTSRKRSQR